MAGSKAYMPGRLNFSRKGDCGMCGRGTVPNEVARCELPPFPIRKRGPGTVSRPYTRYLGGTRTSLFTNHKEGSLGCAVAVPRDLGRCTDAGQRLLDTAGGQLRLACPASCLGYGGICWMIGGGLL